MTTALKILKCEKYPNCITHSTPSFDRNEKKLLSNRPWWPSGLECGSNSSRRSLKAPVLNPLEAWKKLNLVYTQDSLNQWKCKGTLPWFPGKRLNGRVWAPNPGGRSPHHKACSGARMADQMVKKLLSKLWFLSMTQFFLFVVHLYFFSLTLQQVFLCKQL